MTPRVPPRPSPFFTEEWFKEATELHQNADWRPSTQREAVLAFDVERESLDYAVHVVGVGIREVKRLIRPRWDRGEGASLLAMADRMIEEIATEEEAGFAVRDIVVDDVAPLAAFLRKVEEQGDRFAWGGQTRIRTVHPMGHLVSFKQRVQLAMAKLGHRPPIALPTNVIQAFRWWDHDHLDVVDEVLNAALLALLPPTKDHPATMLL